MTLTDLGINYICYNFGDTNRCCTKTGLEWYYTVSGTNYPEMGGTAQIVSRLASGLVDSLTMTNPARGTFTQTQLNTANGGTVTLQDALLITQHDETGETIWCYIPCTAHTTEATCEYYGCYWYNNSCHVSAPTCTDLTNQTDCVAYSCYWYNNSCHGTAPTCEQLNNQTDCIAYTCYWYNNTCHSSDQPQICYWVDTHGGPTDLDIIEIFQIVDAYIYNIPPTGYTFIPTIVQVFGIIDYYLGFISNGNQKTGCNY